MLKSRIITALILAPTIIAAIYLLPLAWFAVVFALLAGLAASEFAALAGIEMPIARTLYAAVVPGMAALGWWLPDLLAPGLAAGIVVWLLAPLVVVKYPRTGTFLARGWPVAVIGLIICWTAWISLVVIRAAPDGANWLLLAMLLVWGADIGAYFSGRRFGRRKLASNVSPGKTWEGVWGGALAALVVGSGLLALMGQFTPVWVILMSGLIAFSVFGDLFESVLKRVKGVKDSGTLLPGHGGVLDRIDSLLAVLPWLALILWFSGLADLSYIP